jgi:hypothetical protein
MIQKLLMQRELPLLPSERADDVMRGERSVRMIDEYEIGCGGRLSKIRSRHFTRAPNDHGEPTLSEGCLL